jgi:hypothetical protein
VPYLSLLGWLQCAEGKLVGTAPRRAAAHLPQREQQQSRPPTAAAAEILCHQGVPAFPIAVNRGPGSIRWTQSSGGEVQRTSHKATHKHFRINESEITLGKSAEI